MTAMILHLDYVQSRLFFTVDADSFPAEDWVDLVSVDLDRWIPRLTSFFMRHTDSCRLDFMDGPFSVMDLPVLIWNVVDSIREYNRVRFEIGEETMYIKERAMLTRLLQK